MPTASRLRSPPIPFSYPAGKPKKCTRSSPTTSRAPRLIVPVHHTPHPCYTTHHPAAAGEPPPIAAKPPTPAVPLPGLRPPNDTPTTPPLRSPYPRGKPRNRRAPLTLQLSDFPTNRQAGKPTSRKVGTHHHPPAGERPSTAQAHPHARLLIPPHARRPFLLSLPPPVTVIAQCSHSTLQSLHNAITPHLYPAAATGEEHHRLARPRHPNPIPFSYPGVNQKPAALLPTSATRDHPHP